MCACVRVCVRVCVVFFPNLLFFYSVTSELTHLEFGLGNFVGISQGT